MSTVQRRRWERVSRELDVEIFKDGAVLGHATTQDVCEGGIGVVSERALAVGDEYGFAIAEIAQTPLVGAVRWCTPSSARSVNVIGVEFTSLTAEQTDMLAGCVARWKAEGAEPGDA